MRRKNLKNLKLVASLSISILLASVAFFFFEVVGHAGGGVLAAWPV
jgi:hypothetical protein